MHKALGIEQLEARMLLSANNVAPIAAADAYAVDLNNALYEGVLINDVITSNGKPYELDVLSVGQDVYIDRSYTFTAIPSQYDALWYIKTANNDKYVSTADHLTFTVTEQATVLIGFDDRATTLPAWLDDGSWTLTNDIIATTDVGETDRPVYSKTFAAGTVTLGGNAEPPEAGAHSNYTVMISRTGLAATGGVLVNDTDADSDPLTAVLVSTTSNGSLKFNPDGSFIYTPDANFNGTDSFTYKSNDGTTDGNTATVTITVNAQNDTPITIDDGYATNEDTTLNIAATGVLANDTDPDSDPLTAILVAGPSNGSLTLNADGSFIYTPDANFNGTDSFTYKSNDGTGDGNTATVTITVNSVNDIPPVDLQPIFGGEYLPPIPVTISPGNSSPDYSRPAKDSSPGRSIVSPSIPGQFGHRGDRITLPNESHGSDSESNDRTNESTKTPTKTELTAPKTVTPDSTPNSSENSNNEIHSSTSNGNSRSNSSSESENSAIATEQGILESGYLAQQYSLRISSQSNDKIVDSVFSKGSVLFSRLDSMNGEIDRAFRSPEAQAAIVTTVTVVAGYVLYDIRKVSFLSALFSSVPHWKRFDPLVVLQSLSTRNGNEKGNDAETLLGLVDEHSLA